MLGCGRLKRFWVIQPLQSRQVHLRIGSNSWFSTSVNPELDQQSDVNNETLFSTSQTKPSRPKLRIKNILGISHMSNLILSIHPTRNEA